MTLVLFLALLIDFGRILIIKGELQNIADSCALAAVAELDGKLEQVARANYAGLQITNLNKKNFQTEQASSIQITPITSVPKQVNCKAYSYDYFSYFLNIFYDEIGLISAEAIAGQKASIKACLLPIGLKEISNSNYAVNTLSGTIKNNLFFADLREDRLDPINFSQLVEGFGLCEISTKYRNITLDVNSNGNVLDALDNRRKDSNLKNIPNRLLIPVPLVSMISPDNNGLNGKILKWACLEILKDSLDFKYVGLVSPSSPCITTGISGLGTDAVGPLVPFLIK